MKFGWINIVNAAAVLYLIAVNLVAYKKKRFEPMKSRHAWRSVAEQIGRYGSMALMILPLGVPDMKFGFPSVGEMVCWMIMIPVLLTPYTLLLTKKPHAAPAVDLSLGILPTALFLCTGILLRHWLLLAFAVLFGAFHLWIIAENKKE